MTPEQVLQALNAASSAGHHEQARALAQLYQQMKSQPPTPGQKGMGSIADSAGQGLFFGFGDEIAGALGATANSAANLFGGGADKPWTQAYQEIRDVSRENQAGFAERNPGTALAAEVGGGLLTGGAGLAKTGALKGGQAVAKMAGIGAGQGGAYGLGQSEAETVGGLLADSAKGAGMGALFGGGIPLGAKAGGRLIRGSRNAQPPQVSQTYRESVGLLEDAGIPLNTGQRVDSESLKVLSSTLEPVPLVGGPLKQLDNIAQEKFQSKLMGMAGFAPKDVRGGRITLEAIENADNEFSKRYAQRLGNKKVNLGADGEFLSDLAGLQGTFDDWAIAPEVVERTVNKVFNKIDDVTGAKRLQNLRSYHSSRAWGARNATDGTRELHQAITDAIDNAVTRAIPGGTADIRRDYTRYMQLRDLWQKNSGQPAASGLLPMQTLFTKAKTQGSGIKDREWVRFINAGSEVLPEALKNSGTPGRLLAAEMVKAPPTSLQNVAGLLGRAAGLRGVAEGLADGAGAGKLLAAGDLMGPAWMAKRATGQGLMNASGYPVGLLGANPLYFATQ